jgi:hypothetical protein
MLEDSWNWLGMSLVTGCGVSSVATIALALKWNVAKNEM